MYALYSMIVANALNPLFWVLTIWMDSIVFHHLLDKDTRMIIEPLRKGLIRVLS